jgi:hypothetical protein
MLADGAFEGFATRKQLDSYLIGRTKNQIGVRGSMVPDDMARLCYSPGDLGPSNYISAHHKKCGFNSVLIENFEQSGGVAIIRAVVEGQRKPFSVMRVTGKCLAKQLRPRDYRVIGEHRRRGHEGSRCKKSYH